MTFPLASVESRPIGLCSSLAVFRDMALWLQAEACFAIMASRPLVPHASPLALSEPSFLLSLISFLSPGSLLRCNVHGRPV